LGTAMMLDDLPDGVLGHVLEHLGMDELARIARVNSLFVAFYHERRTSPAHLPMEPWPVRIEEYYEDSMYEEDLLQEHMMPSMRAVSYVYWKAKAIFLLQSRLVMHHHCDVPAKWNLLPWKHVEDRFEQPPVWSVPILKVLTGYHCITRLQLARFKDGLVILIGCERGLALYDVDNGMLLQFLDFACQPVAP
jgi:hypothetical protein